MSHKLIPMIRCTSGAEQQAEYYCSLFPDAKISKQNPVVTTFEIFWQTLSTINWGDNSQGKLNPSISLSLWIKDRSLTEQLRAKLSDGGSIMMDFADYPRSKWYGRCNDKFGVSRQVMYDDRADTTDNALIPSLMYTGANSGKAEEAMNLYTSIFPASKIDMIARYGAGENDVEGFISHAEFTLVNQTFIAMDSSWPHAFTFNEGLSIAVSCTDQEEVDIYRNALIADGWQEVQCGRCKDKYGVSRQIVPVQLQESLFQADQEKAQYAMKAMLQMKKIIIEDLYQK